LLIAFLLVLLLFAVSLLLAIAGLVIAALTRGGTVDMTFAYRDIAVPVAIVAGPFVLVAAFVLEIRHYRRAKALFSIERAG
jgi:hypothetical protein